MCQTEAKKDQLTRSLVNDRRVWAASALLIIALFVWSRINPQPTQFSIPNEDPNLKFMNVANSLIQLTANYRPDTAQAQFEIAKSLWWNPPLTQFQRPLLPAKEQAELEEKRNSYQEFLASELRTILDTKRSQTLLISNGQLSKVEKLSDFDMVRVRLATGLQLKSVGDKILSAEKAVYYVTMMPFQRNAQEEPEVFVVDVQVRHPDEPL